MGKSCTILPDFYVENEDRNLFIQAEYIYLWRFVEIDLWEFIIYYNYDKYSRKLSVIYNIWIISLDVNICFEFLDFFYFLFC